MPDDDHLRRCSRQCLHKTHAPVDGFPLWTAGSGFVAHIAGRTCFFTARHVVADSEGVIDEAQLRRILVVKDWGDERGRNLSFEESYFPRIPETAGARALLNDVLLLACHHRAENVTDDGIYLFDDERRASPPVFSSVHRLWIYGFPNIPGSPPIDYESRVYRPQRIEVQARFDRLELDGQIGVGTVLHAFSEDGEPFSMVRPPDGMSGSVVLEEDPVDGDFRWAGMLIQAANNTVRFITAPFLFEFAVRVVRQERAAGRW